MRPATGKKAHRARGRAGNRYRLPDARRCGVSALSLFFRDVSHGLVFAI